MSIQGIKESMLTSADADKTRLRIAVRSRGSEEDAGDTASFSGTALQRAAALGDDDFMSSNKVRTKLRDGSNVEFNSKTSAIVFNGSKLKLNGFAKTTVDDLAIQKDGNAIKVHNLSSGQTLLLNNDGSRGEGAAQSIVPGPTSATDVQGPALFINNTGRATRGTDEDDVIINRQTAAQIDGGAGNDTIFNFATTGTQVSGGTGNDAVYSVGLVDDSEIDISSGDGYVKLVSNSTGGRINLGSGSNFVNATGKKLTGVTITDNGAGSSVVAAKSLKDAHVTLQASETALDVGAVISSEIQFGSGANSFVASKITGSAEKQSKIIGRGINTYRLGAVKNTLVDSQDAASDAVKITKKAESSIFALSKGDNLIDARDKTLTSVTISSETGGNGTTRILAAKITGSNAKHSVIDLKAGEASSIEVAKEISNTDISTGEGANSIQAESLKSVTVSMGQDSTKSQTLKIKEKVNKLTYFGGDSGHALSFSGKLTNSKITTGEGDTNARFAKGAKKLVYTGGSGNDALSFGANVKASDIHLGTGHNVVSTGVGNFAHNVVKTTITADGTGSNTITVGLFKQANGRGAINLGQGDNTLQITKLVGTNRIDASKSTGAFNLKVGSSLKNLTILGSSKANSIVVGGGLTNVRVDLGEGGGDVTAKSAASKNLQITSRSTNAVNVQLESLLRNKKGQSAITIHSGGGGKIDIIRDARADFDFTGSTDAVELSIGRNLTKSYVRLGGGNSTVLVSNRNLGRMRDTVINAGSGAVTLNTRDIESSTINMNTQAAGTTVANLAMRVAGSLTKSSVFLGKGQSSVFVDSIDDGTTVTMGEGNTDLFTYRLGSKKGNRVAIKAYDGAAPSVDNKAQDTITVWGTMTNADLLAGARSTDIGVAKDVINSNIDLGGGNNQLIVWGTVKGSAITGSGSGDSLIELNNLVRSGKKRNTISFSGKDNSTGIQVLGELKGTDIIMTGRNNGLVVQNKAVNGTGVDGNTFTFGSDAIAGTTNTLIFVHGLSNAAVNARGGTGSHTSFLSVSTALTNSVVTISTDNSDVNVKGIQNSSISMTGNGKNYFGLRGIAHGNNQITANGFTNIWANDTGAFGGNAGDLTTISMKDGTITAKSNQIRNVNVEAAGTLKLEAQSLNKSTVKGKGIIDISGTLSDSKVELTGDSTAYINTMKSSEVFGTGKNELYISSMDGLIDASQMYEDTKVSLGTSFGEMRLGYGTTVEVAAMERGVLNDTKGGNLFIGTLGANASVNITGQDLTTVKINEIVGKMNFEKASYAEGNASQFTIYNSGSSFTSGQIQIGGEKVTSGGEMLVEPLNVSRYGKDPRVSALAVSEEPEVPDNPDGTGNPGLLVGINPFSILLKYSSFLNQL